MVGQGKWWLSPGWTTCERKSSDASYQMSVVLPPQMAAIEWYSAVAVSPTCVIWQVSPCDGTRHVPPLVWLWQQRRNGISWAMWGPGCRTHVQYVRVWRKVLPLLWFWKMIKYSTPTWLMFWKTSSLALATCWMLWFWVLWIGGCEVCNMPSGGRSCSWDILVLLSSQQRNRRCPKYMVTNLS